ncbi:MAG: hypothetical protein RLZZ312_762 [Bacteroidota bacterium]|jgi:hypothetical protein
MNYKNIDILKSKIQLIIDAIALKKYDEATSLHTETSELIDEIIDHLDDDADLIEVSKYQVLINKLFEEISQ